MAKKNYVKIDVIIPVHNAADTVEETVLSALHQIVPQHVSLDSFDYDLNISVCCYDDGSTDKSWEILSNLQKRYKADATKKENNRIPSRLLIAKSEGVGRGAGYARNRAAELSSQEGDSIRREGSNCVERFMCLLDSDDLMHPARVVEQTLAMMKLPQDERNRTLMGCKVVRDPPYSTWHYTQWANSLTDERLMLERFRECTLLQPTWFLTHSRFELLGGYIEAPCAFSKGGLKDGVGNRSNNSILRLIHPTFDTPKTLRLAEDLRFFHSHLHANGLLQLHRCSEAPDLALVTYRHRANQSQSSQTPRKLLLHLRSLAFEMCVLEKAWPTSRYNGRFVVWGQGRDGKDFVKALSPDARKRVYCFVDVDCKKIEQGFYVNQEMDLKIPIVHFSLLAKSEEQRQKLLESKSSFGQIDKSKPQEKNNNQPDSVPKAKKQKVYGATIAASPKAAKTLNLALLPELPVVVCVSMYRTNGALEANVKRIGRTEGESLWHFS